jgi:hypothetical protein
LRNVSDVSFGGGNQRPNHNTLEGRVEDRFDGSNYHTWKFRPEMILLDKDLWLVVDGKSVRPSTTNGQTTWERRDQRAKASFIINLRNNQMHLVTSAKTSWRCGINWPQYLKPNTSHQMSLLPFIFYSKKMSEVKLRV